MRTVITSRDLIWPVSTHFDCSQRLYISWKLFIRHSSHIQQFHWIQPSRQLTVSFHLLLFDFSNSTNH